jgi:3-deoxy-D-manno-octulosonic-acid transferase
MENFREMAANFLGAGAAIEVSNAEDLGAAWCGLLKDPDRAARMGAAARNLVDQNRGATSRVLEHVAHAIDAQRGGM